MRITYSDICMSLDGQKSIGACMAELKNAYIDALAQAAVNGDTELHRVLSECLAQLLCIDYATEEAIRKQ